MRRWWFDHLISNQFMNIIGMSMCHVPSFVSSSSATCACEFGYEISSTAVNFVEIDYDEVDERRSSNVHFKLSNEPAKPTTTTTTKFLHLKRKSEAKKCWPCDGWQNENKFRRHINFRVEEERRACDYYRIDMSIRSCKRCRRGLDWDEKCARERGDAETKHATMKDQKLLLNRSFM